MKKLKYKPISIAQMLRKTEIIIIELSLWDNKNEIAPGRINNPIAKIIPTAFKVAIIINDNAASKP